MKRKIAVTLLILFIISCFIMTFTACGNTDDNGDTTNVGGLENPDNSGGSSNTDNGGNTEQSKSVPVYQGMTITKSNSVLSLPSYRMSGITLLSANNENNGDNGNHHGHYKGDHTDRNDTIDEDNPYPDNNANENIEKEIKSSLNVVGSPDEIYYATPNEDIYINIHIDNPDSFEIMSFTLNGKKYSSYMFEEGSDMETIVLKYNVGDATGIVEYTIDAIKYIDGTEIKDVIIDGNKTVMAGIRTENQVVASVTDVDIDTNVLSFNVNVKDDNSLVEFSKGALKAVIYDGFNVISEKDIAVGNNSVIFDGLKTNTVYQYAVVGYYDDLSGGGFGMNVLYKDAFYTDSVVLFDNITVGQESISFGYLWHEDHQGKAISALKLYKGDAFIKDITASATTVNELLSGTTYKLVAEYPNADKTESIYLEFATFAKATPEVSVLNPIKTQTSVGFEIVETDADNVGTVTKIELVHTNGTVVADSLDQRAFANLLSNNAYTVKVTYVYNLNDGEGEHTVTKELAITTDAKAAPEILVVSPTKTQTSVGFEIAENDTDNIGAVAKIELYKGNELVKTADNLTAREFTGLLSNNTYTVKVTYAYNLNDGEGEHTVTKELAITTLAKATPDFTITNTNKTQTSLGFSVNVTDTDSVGAVTKVELIHGTNVTTLGNATNHAINDLLSNNDYTIKVTYTYDLNDGVGNRTIAHELTAKTIAKATPEISVHTPTKSQTTVGFSITETDTDNVGTFTKIELYKGNELVKTADSLNTREFTELLSNNTYTVKVTYVYNLNDGEGEHTVTKELAITTDAKAAPKILVVSPTKTQTSVGFEISENDSDNVGAVTKIELVHTNGTVVADSLDQRAFANLLSNNAYTVKVTYVYNLNDGEGEHTITKELAITTDAKAAPEILVVSPTKTQTSVGFEISENDSDNVGTVTKIELVHTNGTVVANSLDQRAFANLLSNNAYTVKVTYVYNLNDGEGEHTVTKELAITTDAKTVPNFTVKNESITTRGITAGYDIADSDSILSEYKIELYKGTSLVLENTNKEIDFTGLNYYTDYTLKITYTYNLNDGKGVQTSIFEKNYKTLPSIDVLECSVINTNAVSDGDTIFMSVKINNPYGIEIESVNINGKVYSVTGNSVQNQIFVEIVCDGQFNGGDTNLKIEHVNAKIDNKTISIAPQYEVSDNIFINGTLEVISIEYVNENFEPIHYSIGSDRIFVLLTVDNPTGYNIDDMKEVGLYTDFTKNFIKIDNDHWYYEYFWDWEGGMDGKYEINVESISYSNQHISKTVTSHIKTNEIMLISNPDPVYISEPDDLKNMSYGRYYVLINDIDLAGLEWQGADFYGIFDGNGYSIKNMSFVGTIKKQSANLGLFNNADGIIKNLNLSSVLIMLEAASDANGHCELSCGAIAARASKCVIQNCTVDSNSIINVKNTTSGTSYVGGIVGYISDNAQISQCTNNGSVNSVSTYYCTYTGGLIGYSNNAIVTNCINNGNINATSQGHAYIGGLVGYSTSRNTIKNSMNTGKLAGYAMTPVIGGLISLGAIEISNCVNAGVISLTEFSGGLSYSSTGITNSYSLYTELNYQNGASCTIYQLNSKSFYTETLGWSENVWDFSELDVENGKYPKLKH